MSPPAPSIRDPVVTGFADPDPAPGLMPACNCDEVVPVIATDAIELGAGRPPRDFEPPTEIAQYPVTHSLSVSYGCYIKS